MSYFTAAYDGIELSLRNLRQTLPSHSANRKDLIRIAEIKRLTALLYLRERIGSPLSPDNSGIDDAVAVATNLRTPYKRHLVSSIIHLISTVPVSATLLWPLFIVGNAGLDDEEHRRFVLDKLEMIQQTRNLGSVRRARIAVEQAFRAHDLGHRGKAWGDDDVAYISLA